MKGIALSTDGYWFARFVFERGLGLVYLIAFLVALNQFRPLLGERGLLPVPAFVKGVSFREAPSLFHFFPNDTAFAAFAWIGIVLSSIVLSGLSERYGTPVSMIIWAALWAIYLSFVNVGQIFYAFGWESILLEAGFFAMFLGGRATSTSLIALWLVRWLEFRVMFGAGLIKLRGDPCWRKFTCLDYHYETQPMPNPLSWYFHWAPRWTHVAGVGFNHFCELIVPFGYFLPQPVASIAGILTIVFQALIMASGNLSWLNFMTIVLAVPMLDDRIFAFLAPLRPAVLHEPHVVHKIAILAVAAMVAVMSIDPIRNMISPNQVMNTEYNPYHLVGTYGAFGSVTRMRFEVIVEGTDDAAPGPSTKWREYEFKGKPGDVSRIPPQIAPYHLRLDWLMWFAAMSDYYDHPWFVHLMGKLLQGDAGTLSLLKTNPFPNHAPRFVRAELYKYEFTTPDEKRATGHWWKRERAGIYFPAVSLDMPEFHSLLEQRGWL